MRVSRNRWCGGRRSPSSCATTGSTARWSPRQRPRCPRRSAGCGTGITATPGSATRPTPCSPCAASASAPRPTHSWAGCWTPSNRAGSRGSCTTSTAARCPMSGRIPSSKATVAPPRCDGATARPTSASTMCTARYLTARTSGPAAAASSSRRYGRRWPSWPTWRGGLAAAGPGHLGGTQRGPGLHLLRGDVPGGAGPGCGHRRTARAARTGPGLAGSRRQAAADHPGPVLGRGCSDAERASWRRVVAPVLSAWSKDLVPLLEYPAGSQGPGPVTEEAGRRPAGGSRGVVPPGQQHTPLQPWWDPGADTSVSPETDHVLVAGVRVARGSRVVMRPGSRRADAQDIFLTGREALVEAVLHDVDGQVHVAVSPVSDPLADLQRNHGRFLYFAPDEIEPVPAASGGGNGDDGEYREGGTR